MKMVLCIFYYFLWFGSILFRNSYCVVVYDLLRNSLKCFTVDNLLPEHVLSLRIREFCNNLKQTVTYLLHGVLRRFYRRTSKIGVSQKFRMNSISARLLRNLSFHCLYKGFLAESTTVPINSEQIELPFICRRIQFHNIYRDSDVWSRRRCKILFLYKFRGQRQQKDGYIFLFLRGNRTRAVFCPSLGIIGKRAVCSTLSAGNTWVLLHRQILALLRHSTFPD